MIVCRFCKSENPEERVACRACGVPLSTPQPTPADAPIASAAAPSPAATPHKTLQQLAIERGGCLSEREAVAYILRAAKTVREAHSATARESATYPAILRARSLALDPAGRVVFVDAARAENGGCDEFQLARQLAIVLVELLSGAVVPFQEPMPPAPAFATAFQNCRPTVQDALRAAFGNSALSLPDWLAMLRPTVEKAAPPIEPPAVGMSRVATASETPAREVAPMKPSSAEGSTLAASSAASTPFQIGTLSPLRRIAAGESRFTRVVFGAGGKEVWSADEMGLVQVWSTVTGSNLARLDTRFKGGGRVTAMAFAIALPGQSTLAPENAELIATGHDDGRLRVWDVRANKLRKVIDAHDARVDALTFCAPGGVLLNLVSGGSDGALLMWDATAGSRLHLIREDSHIIKVLAVSAHGREVALGGDDGRVEVWSPGAERRLWSSRLHDFWVTSLTISPNARMLASGGYDRSTRLWATATGAELHTLSGHQSAISGLAFAPDNRVLATAGADGTVRLWDAWTAQAGPVLADVGGAVNAVAWSPGGRVLATASDSALMLWRRDT